MDFNFNHQPFENNDFEQSFEQSSSMTLEENVQNLMSANDDDYDPTNVYDRMAYESQQRVLVEPVTLLPLTAEGDDVRLISDVFATGAEYGDEYNQSDFISADDDVSAVASRFLFEGIAEESAVYEKNLNANVADASFESSAEAYETSDSIAEEECNSTNQIEELQSETITRIPKQENIRRTSNITSHPCSPSKDGMSLRRSQRRLARHSTENLTGKNIEEKAKFLKARQNSIGETIFEDGGFKTTPQFSHSPKMRNVSLASASRTADSSDEDDDTPLGRFLISKNKSSSPPVDLDRCSRTNEILGNFADFGAENSHKQGSEEDISSEEAEVEGEPVYCYKCAKIGMPNRMVICSKCRNAFHNTCESLKPAENLREWTCRCCVSLANLPLKMKRKRDSSTSFDKIKKIRQRKMTKPKTDVELSSNFCYFCRKFEVESDDSIYCGDSCIQKMADKTLETYKDATQRVAVCEKGGSNQTLRGNVAPMVKNMADWLKRHRRFYPDLDGVSIKKSQPSTGVSTKQSQSSATRPDSDGSLPQVSSAASTTIANVDNVRMAVRKTLRDCLISRSKDADDVLLSNEEIKRFAVDIENEMFKTCGDTGMNYKQHFKGLIVNLKDNKNRGFFRRILNGTLSARKVAAMSGQEMAARENSYWATSEDEDSSKIVENHSDKTKMFTKTKAEADSTCDIFGLLVGDTTTQHKSHLFDLNCKICTGKQKSDDDLITNTIKTQKDHSTDNDSTTSTQRESFSSECSKANLPRAPASASNADSFKSRTTQNVSAEGHSKTFEAVATTSAESKQSSRAIKKPSVEEDYVWRGLIDMPGYFRFDVNFVGVSGLTQSLKRDLPNHLRIVGRIGSDTVFDYVKSMKSAPTKDVLVVRIEEPSDKGAFEQYRGLYNNMVKKGRFCVVDTSRMAKIKDLYLSPLSSGQAPDSSLVPFDGQGLPVPRNDLIIGIIVRRRERIDLEKHEPPPVPQVPENLKSKLLKNANQVSESFMEEPPLTKPTSEVKIIKFSSASDNEEEAAVARSLSVSVAQPFLGNKQAPTVLVGPYGPEYSNVMNQINTSQGNTTIGNLQNQGNTTVAQPGPSCSADEWKKWWNNVLMYWQSTGVGPSNFSSVPQPGAQTLPLNPLLPQPMLNSSSTISANSSALPNLPNVNNQSLEDGEIEDDDEVKQRTKLSQREAKGDVDWRKLSPSKAVSNSSPTPSAEKRQPDYRQQHGDTDYRIKKK